MRLRGPERPPYAVPTMAEIYDRKTNGFKVVSTFSGCGGSCLGFEMAGYDVLWANEFIPAAQETYRANHRGVILNCEDIRKVEARDVLSRIHKEQGEVDVLEGSPPCASFSTAGKREKGWGDVRKYSDTEQRVDDLFFEFVRLISGIRPKVFVAENVSGLVKGVAKGYFKNILAAMKACDYRVECRQLDAQWLGVPQVRQRVIFVGVRSDLELDPVFPRPLPYRYSVRDALVGCSPTIETEAWIDGQAIGREWDRLKVGGQSDKYFNLVRAPLEDPCPTVTASGGQNSGIACVTHPLVKRKFSIQELKRLCSFPDDFVLTGTYAQQYERLGRSVPPLMMRAVASTIATEILAKC